MTTEERIAQLEARIDTIQEAHDSLRRQLAQAHVDQWQGRIDDLELQAHLGRAEANERVAMVVAKLNTKWSKIRQQLATANSTTADVSETIRGGIENAYKDVRDALIESRRQLS